MRAATGSRSNRKNGYVQELLADSGDARGGGKSKTLITALIFPGLFKMQGCYTADLCNFKYRCQACSGLVMVYLQSGFPCRLNVWDRVINKKGVFCF